MSAGSQNEVLFGDGEDVILDDLNNAQRYAKSLIVDQLLGGAALHDVAVPWPTANAARLVYVPRAGSAFPYGTGTNRQLTNSPGVVCQWTATGAPDGLTQRLLTYQLAQDELITTFAANASGNDRIDLLAIKLSQAAAGSTTRDFKDAATGATSSQVLSKLWQTQLSISVVQGTPAATPSKPAIPAGYAAYAYAYIPNGFAATFGSKRATIDNVVWDNRMPMRMRTIRVPASAFFGFTNYSYSNGLVTRSGAGGFYAPIPVGPDSRIVRISLLGTTDEIVTAQVYRNTAGGTFGVNSYGFPGTVGSFGSALTWFMTDSADGTVNGAQGAPTWGDGSSAGIMWAGGSTSEFGYFTQNGQMGLIGIFTDGSGTTSKFNAVEIAYAS